MNRTRFLAHLERLNTRYHAFLRPRRFGKSLAIARHCDFMGWLLVVKGYEVVVLGDAVGSMQYSSWQ